MDIPDWIDRMKGKKRMIAIMFCLQNKTPKEIKKKIGPPNYVDKVISELRKKMKSLARAGGIDSNEGSTFEVKVATASPAETMEGEQIEKNEKNDATSFNYNQLEAEALKILEEEQDPVKATIRFKQLPLKDMRKLYEESLDAKGLVEAVELYEEIGAGRIKSLRRINDLRKANDMNFEALEAKVTQPTLKVEETEQFKKKEKYIESLEASLDAAVESREDQSREPYLDAGLPLMEKNLVRHDKLGQLARLLYNNNIQRIYFKREDPDDPARITDFYAKPQKP